MARANIKAIQAKVNEISSYNLKIDGWAGKATLGAVIDLLDRLDAKRENTIFEKPDGPKTAHFSLAEFKCRDGSEIPKKLYSNGQIIMDGLEKIRVLYGKPIVISSGYRSQKYNDNLAQNRSKRKPTISMHILFGAADIKGADGKVKELGLIVKRLFDEGVINGAAFGIYFIHVDFRGDIAYKNDSYLGFYNDIMSFDEWKRKAR